MPYKYLSDYLAWRTRRTQEIRDQLIAQLGGRCASCGSTKKLEFNHIYEREWKHHKRRRYQRMLQYRKEAAQGLVNLLCKNCNRLYKPLPF